MPGHPAPGGHRRRVLRPAPPLPQLDTRANHLAHLLRRNGVGPHVPVALCLERSLELIVSLLAILEAGGAQVPLDVSYPEQRLAFMLKDSQPRVLLTTQVLAPRLTVASHLPHVFVEYGGGPGLARGYLGQLELTAERFLPHPFSATPGERLYRTGDLARWREDGVLEFLGRADTQVKVRGFRIELGEVEAALCRHPAVREVQALARPGRSGEQELVSYVVAAGSAPTVGELRRHRQGSLPGYMVPARLVVVGFPLTPNGKVNVAALPAPEEGEPGRAERPAAEHSHRAGPGGHLARGAGAESRGPP